MKLQWQNASTNSELNFRFRPFILLFFSLMYALSLTSLIAYIFYLDPFPLFLGMGLSAAILLVLEALTRIPKLSVPVFFVGLSALALAILFSGTVQESLSAFFQNFAEGALKEMNDAWMGKGHSAFSEGTQAQMYYLMVFLFSVLSFFVVRLFRQSTIMMMILILVAAQGEFQALPALLIPTSLGILSILFVLGQASDFSVKHLRMPVLRIVAALAAALLLNHFLAPQVLYNARLDRFLKETESALGQEPKQKEYVAFNLNSAGYPDTKELGGPIQINEAPFADVSAGPKRLYLRGAVYSTYSGRGWSKEGMEQAQVFGAEHSKEAQASAFYLNLEENSPLVSASTYTVKPIMQPQQVILLAGPPTKIALNASEFNEAFYFNYSASVYLGQTIPPSGYRVEARAFDLSLNNYDEQIAQLGQFPAEGRLLSDEERRFWTSVPESVDSNLLQRFLDETQGFASAKDELGTAIQIKNRLSSDHFHYALDVSPVPEGREFVSFFLEQKEGYCSYFATALTVLCRQAGVPARYVEGYVLPASTSQGESTRTLTGKQAHAWTEIWIDGAGWLPLDATPAAYQERLGASEEEKTTESSETKTEPSTQESSQETSAPTTSDAKEPESKQEAFDVSSLFPYLIALLVIAAFVAFYQWRRKDLLRRHQLEWQMSQAHGDSALLIERVWKDMKKLAALHELKQTSGQSIKQFLATWPLPLQLEHTPALLEKALYSEHSLDEDELLFLFSDYQQLEDYSREQVPTRRWLFKRFLSFF